MTPPRAHAVRRAAQLLALTLGLAVSAGSPAAQALERVPGTATRLESLTFDQAALTLTRGALARVNVSAHLIDPDPDGVVAASEGVSTDAGAPCPCVIVGRESDVGTRQASGWRVVSLSLASGTAQDGVWVGGFTLGAIDNGMWTATQIAAGDLRRQEESQFDSNTVAVDGLIDAVPVVAVTGSDWPVLSLTLPRGPVPFATAYVVSGTARYSATHAPAARLSLQVRHSYCDESGAGQLLTTVTTDAAGRFTATGRQAAGTWCAFFGAGTGTQPVSEVNAHRAFVQSRVSVRLSSPTVRAGRPVTLRGTTGGAMEAVVERLQGRRWVRVKTVSGTRWNVTFVPRRGTTTLRVRTLPDTSNALPFATPAFRVRAI